MRPGCRRVCPRSLGLLGCTLGVSGFAVFIGVLPRGRWVHPGSLGLLGCAVYRYIGVRLGGCRGADRFTPWESPRSSGFIGVRVGGRRVHMGSLECALGVVRFILCHWVHWGMHWGSSGVDQLISVYLGVVGFVRGRWVHWGALWGLSGPFGAAGFNGVRPFGRRVRPWSLRCAMGVVGFFGGPLISFGCALGVVGFIRNC